MTWARTTPARVWAVCAAFAMLQPLTHGLVALAAPDGVVPTGLHKPDSAIFVHAMRMFDTGFYSPYATCQSPLGDHSWRMFVTPFYLLYGIAGAIGVALRVGEFLMLGAANGFGAACYLLAVYHFMRTVLPARADRAFVLLAFSGGLGGAVYVACAEFGVTDTAAFAERFYRFAIYDLVEGTNLAPYLLMPRLYYTLPLALGYAGLTTLIVAWRIQCPVHLAYAQALLFVCALLNARLGPPLGAVIFLYVTNARPVAWRRIAHAALPLVCGVMCAAGVMRMNPGFVDNVHAAVRQQMWLSSFVSAAFPLLLFAAPVVLRDARTLARGQRAIAFAGLGYFAVFTVLSVCYQVYYGTWLTGADHAASVRVSDMALVGGALGAVWHFRSRATCAAGGHGWLVLWAVLFAAVAVSAFGQGWSLRYAPQRLMVFLGVPLSLLAAEGMARIEAARPRRVLACMALVLAIGIPSLAVSTLVFQGPLGMRPGLASNIGMHAAYLPKADVECLRQLGPGVVAAPWPYNDIVSVREGTKVIGGYGALDLAGMDASGLDAEVARFFTPGTPDAERVEFLRRWCVEFVYVPSDMEVRDALRREYDRWNAVRRTTEVDGAALYAVR